MGDSSNGARPVADVDDEALSTFVAGLRGRSLRPGDGGYDEARQVFNRMHLRRPGLIVQCAGVADVVDAVRFAAQHGLLLAVRAGGHNVASNGTCEGGLVIDLRAMRSVHVDRARKVARVQGGATWGDLDRETQLHGLAVPGGAVSTTGVAGLTLGGGLGWLRRRYGLSCDALVSAEVVTAAGEVVTASEAENPDLFWALRGGGGNFGVVTSFEFALVPAGPIVAVAIPMYPMEEAPKVMRAWRDWTRTLPDSVTTHCFAWTVPDTPPLMPPPVQGRNVIITPALFAGPVEEGEKLLAPARSFGTPIVDLSGPMPYVAMQTAFDPFVGGMAEHECYWKSHFANEISDDVIDIIVRRIADRPDPWTLVNIPLLGGAIARVASDATAYPNRSPRYMISIDGMWHDASRNAANVEWVRSFWRELAPHATGGVYVNFAGHEEDAQSAADTTRAVYGPSYERLAAVKRKYDPRNLFRLNQNIQPAS